MPIGRTEGPTRPAESWWPRARGFGHSQWVSRRPACRRGPARGKGGGGAAAEGESGVLEGVFGREPDPGLATEVAEECDRLLAALGDAELRRVALLRMDGHSVEEVAERVGCAPRSVKRKLQLIRSIWEREAGDDRG